MKKILITILFLVGAAANAADNVLVTQQERVSSSNERFFRRIIPQVQWIYSSYQNPDVATLNRQGWGAGATFDIGTAMNLVVETGLLYRQLNGGFQDTFGTSEFTNNYLSIPLDLKYYFAGQEMTSLYIKAGVMGSTLASSTVTNSPGFAGSPQNAAGRTWETAGVAGVGLKFVTSKTSDFIVEADYNRPTDTLFTNATNYYSSWNISAGVGVNL
jgi:hypothetical protein